MAEKLMQDRLAAAQRELEPRLYSGMSRSKIAHQALQIATRHGLSPRAWNWLEAWALRTYSPQETARD